MGERFAAFVCDGLIQTALVETFLTLSPSLSGFEGAVVLLIPVAYMTLTEFFFHGSPGKRLLGIEVRADSPELGYPTLFRLQLRESLGKFVAGLFLGIGFLVGFRNPKTKTWADSMAGTVVVKTRAASRFRGLVVPMAIIAYFVAPMAWKGVSANLQRYATDRMIATESGIDRLHEKIFLSLFSGQRWLAGAPEQEKAYQQQMSTLLPTLDLYDRMLAREQGQVQQLRRVIKSRKSSGTNEVDVYEKVIPLRWEISGLVRKHIRKALDSSPQPQAWKALLEDRWQTMRAINDGNNEINRIGETYIPHTVGFRGNPD
jgi:uncharacterized RDD family membrane protein YckC